MGCGVSAVSKTVKNRNMPVYIFNGINAIILKLNAMELIIMGIWS